MVNASLLAPEEGSAHKHKGAVTETDVLAAQAAVVSEAEVFEAQARWVSAIKSISKAYLEKGDYVKVAGDAAGIPPPCAGG